METRPRCIHTLGRAFGSESRLAHVVAETLQLGGLDVEHLEEAFCFGKRDRR